MSDPQKEQLHGYLVESREAVIWKAEGLSEYDMRRPLTRTGTNLLGLIKHLSIVEACYLGQTFDRPFRPHLPWWDADQPEGSDMWVSASEPSADVIATYRSATAHADETIAALDLDAPGLVAWWSRPRVTLHGILVHVLAETARHAGHADIVREQVDGRSGMRATTLDQDPHDEDWWSDHRSKIESAARAAKTRN